MHAQFLSDGSDFRARGGGGHFAKDRRDNGLFWWTNLITLLIGVATCCWFFSIMVFKYPEKPFNYRLLTKLEKLEPIAKFDPLAAGGGGKKGEQNLVLRLPNGTFNNARDLLNKYYNYNPDQLRLTNSVLKRSYILNYSEESPVYVKGTYAVTFVRPLTAADLVKNGWVVRAHSVDLEDVEIELMLPGKPADPKAPPYHEGESFTLDNKSSFCSVIHVLRNQDADGLCATVVPIGYGSFNLGNQRSLALAPPTTLNVEAPLPITGVTPGNTDASKVTAQATGF
jgi:hypothetical protein